MNLVGHVAVASHLHVQPSASFLAGAMLPDLGAIARVRLQSSAPSPGDHGARELAAGIAVHHVSDAAFHSSRWFREHNPALRDALLDAGVDRGAARACAHAGLEMLLDGHLLADGDVAAVTGTALGALAVTGDAHDAAVALAAPGDRTVWRERLDRIARSIDPAAYESPAGVAHRLERMTRGRARIELRPDQVATVAVALERYRPVVARDGAGILHEVLLATSAARAGAGVGVDDQVARAGTP